MRARDQIDTVMSLGMNVTLGGYGWLYKDVDPAQQANDWADFIEAQGVSVPYLWMDEEPYQTNDNLASIEQMKQCAQQLRDSAYNPGVYTGPWVWSLLRNVVDEEINIMPLFTAEYNDKATLHEVTLYGGWGADSVVGHQYTSQGIDQSVFDKRYTIL